MQLTVQGQLQRPSHWETGMKLSTKGRYAMVALADIALQPEGTLVTLADIAQRH